MIYLFLNGDVPAKSDYYKAQPHKVIAVDGGFNKIPKTLQADILIGDMDSVKKVPIVKTIKHPVEKNQSDLELALEYIFNNHSIKEKIVVFGLTGGRVDHQLFNLFVLREYAKKIDFICETEKEKILVTKGDSLIKNFKGKTFSIFPLEDYQKITIRGAKYPLKEKKINMGDSLTLSNVCIDEELFVYSKGVVAIIINK
ncbi:thiamine diphosphokinase [Proteinivorax tanatarense]|uniref:Thiamine diphosphokinase n=1 Tax=Proteinivorax tanatarense TaxID=1260629 RepID=A0AAU7VQ12_9FIRM